MGCITEKCQRCFNWNYDGCANKTTICEFDEKLSRKKITEEIYDLMDSNMSEEHGEQYNRGLEQVLATISRICLRKQGDGRS